MTTTSAIALAVFAVAAVGDWVAIAMERTALEYVCKPAATAALVAAAATVDTADGARRWWFVAALVLSLAGDVLLMLPADLFVAGLAAFLVAHVAYVIGFWVDPPSAVALAVGLLLTALAVVPLAVRILSAIRAGPEPEVRGPVAGYIVVISAMVASAIASRIAWATAGAVLFAASDSMIAWNRFVQRFAAASIAIMVTYHLGQLGLVVSLT
jgi:uncharacterized membrane protein YhhN